MNISALVPIMALTMAPVAHSKECIISKATYETHMLASDQKVVGDVDMPLVGAFLKIFNASPPPTNFKADAITVYDGTTDKVHVVMFLKGCFVHDSVLPQGGFDGIMKEATDAGPKV